MSHKLSRHYLKDKTQEFDLQTIFILNLKNEAISDLDCIGECVNLVYLDLSHNNLFSVMALRTLTLLERLDISDNRLSALSGFESLESLTWLNASGNHLNNTDCLLPLTKLEKLNVLILKDGFLTNPLYGSGINVKNEVLVMLPSLLMLNNESLVAHGKDFYNMCSEMENLAKDYSSLIQVDFSKWKSYYPESSLLRIGIEKNEVYEAVHNIAMECEDLSKEAHKQLIVN